MIIFIVPYRDRENQKDFFYRHMTKHVLKEMKEGKDYKILFIHQNDKRPFNRGGMKNIGFLVVKKLYPKEWKEITLVFNDIDTMPFKENYLIHISSCLIDEIIFDISFIVGLNVGSWAQHAVIKFSKLYGNTGIMHVLALVSNFGKVLESIVGRRPFTISCAN